MRCHSRSTTEVTRPTEKFVDTGKRRMDVEADAVMQIDLRHGHRLPGYGSTITPMVINVPTTIIPAPTTP
jgi:hypothetical protein